MNIYEREAYGILGVGLIALAIIASAILLGGIEVTP